MGHIVNDPSIVSQRLCVPFYHAGEDELEISPYDDTRMDTRMASLVAGKTHSDTCTQTRAHTHSSHLWSLCNEFELVYITVTHVVIQVKLLNES